MRKITKFALMFLIASAFSITSYAQPGCGNTYLGTLTPTTTPQTVNPAAGDSYYWGFSATLGDMYTFNSCNGFEDTYLRIYDASFTLVAENDDDNSGYCPYSFQAAIDWTPTATGTYYVSFAHSYCDPLQSMGDLEYYYGVPVPPPPGDDCSTAVDLNAETSPYNGTITGSNDDFSFCNMSGKVDVIHYFDVPDGHTFDIWQSSNTFDSRHSLRTGGTCPGTTEITCLDDPDDGHNIWTNTTGSTARVWFIVSDLTFNTTGDFVLEWAFITCPAPTTLTETNITTTSADIDWTEDGTATTWEYVYGVAPVPEPATGTSTTTKPVNLTGLTSSTNYDYWVRADCGGDFSTWVMGSFTTATPPPTNDYCSGAITMTCNTTVSGTTIGTTVDTGLPTCGDPFTAKSVWYHFVGTGNDIDAFTCNQAVYGNCSN